MTVREMTVGDPAVHGWSSSSQPSRYGTALSNHFLSGGIERLALGDLVRVSVGVQKRPKRKHKKGKENERHSVFFFLFSIFPSLFVFFKTFFYAREGETNRLAVSSFFFQSFPSFVVYSLFSTVPSAVVNGFFLL